LYIFLWSAILLIVLRQAYLTKEHTLLHFTRIQKESCCLHKVRKAYLAKSCRNFHFTRRRVLVFTKYWFFNIFFGINNEGKSLVMFFQFVFTVWLWFCVRNLSFVSSRYSLRMPQSIIPIHFFISAKTPMDNISVKLTWGKLKTFSNFCGNKKVNLTLQKNSLKRF
jgi:hypothetical protein